MINLDAQSEPTVSLATPNERRTAVRHGWRRDEPCRLTVSHRRESRWVRVKDISEHGVCVLIACALEPGITALLRLRGRRGLPPVELMLQVVHATAQSDGIWAVGCKIDGTHADEHQPDCLQLQEVFEPAQGPEEEARAFLSVPDGAHAWTVAGASVLGVCC